MYFFQSLILLNLMLYTGYTIVYFFVSRFVYKISKEKRKKLKQKRMEELKEGLENLGITFDSSSILHLSLLILSGIFVLLFLYFIYPLMYPREFFLMEDLESLE